jgi:hypothetical protein
MKPITLFLYDLTLEEAQELIRNGADVNEQKPSGKTPLFFVANVEISQLLIDHGADLNIRTNQGETIIDRCEYIKGQRRISFYIENGAIAGGIESYKKLRDLFSQEQQKAFDTFMSITNNDNDFFQMCLAYQNDKENNVKIEIKDMEII